MMIHLLKFIIIFFSISLLGQNKNEDWKTHTSEDILIKYPSNWVIDQSGLMNTKFILFSQLTSDTDHFKENINFIKQDLSNYDISLDEFLKISEEQLLTFITNGKIELSERLNKNGLNFHKIIYTAKQGVFNLKFETFFWVEKKTAYILTFTCEEDQFKIFQKVGEKILNSFIINK